MRHNEHTVWSTTRSHNLYSYNLSRALALVGGVAHAGSTMQKKQEYRSIIVENASRMSGVARSLTAVPSMFVGRARYSTPTVFRIMTPLRRCIVEGLSDYGGEGSEVLDRRPDIQFIPLVLAAGVGEWLSEIRAILVAETTLFCIQICSHKVLIMPTFTVSSSDALFDNVMLLPYEGIITLLYSTVGAMLLLQINRCFCFALTCNLQHIKSILLVELGNLIKQCPGEQHGNA